MLELDQIARLHAALQDGAPWDELLRKERITRAQWLAAERAWLDAMSAEAAAGRFELCDRYMQALLGEPATPTRPAKPLAPPAIEPPAPSPIALSTPEIIPAAMRGFTDVQLTQDASDAQAANPLPFVAANDAAPTVASAAPKSSDSPDWMPKAMRAATSVGETQIASEVKNNPVLPFEAKAPPTPTKSASTKTTDAPWIPPAMRGMANVEETQIASEGAPDGPVLPFDPSAPALPIASEAPTWMPKAMRSISDVGGTHAAPELPSGPALPFKEMVKKAPTSPEAAAGPSLPLEHYAALCVELALWPAHHAEILRRYAIDEAQRRELDAFWSPRVKMDANLRAAWDGYYMAHWTRLHDARKPR